MYTAFYSDINPSRPTNVESFLENREATEPLKMM
jgi:hypothetical protein